MYVATWEVCTVTGNLWPMYIQQKNFHLECTCIPTTYMFGSVAMYIDIITYVIVYIHMVCHCLCLNT